MIYRAATHSVTFSDLKRPLPPISRSNRMDLSYEQRLAKIKLWSLEDRRTRADLIEVYKIIHGLSAVRFSTFFELSHNERTSGHSLKLHKKRVMTDLRQHFFSDRIVNKWKSLSEDIILASSLNNFKEKLQRLHNDGSSTGFFKVCMTRLAEPVPMGRPNPVSYPVSNHHLMLNISGTVYEIETQVQ